MIRFRSPHALIVLLCLGLPLSVREASGQTKWSRAKFDALLQRTQVHPNWLPGESALWYSISDGTDAPKYVRVNTQTGEKTTSGDLDKLGLSSDRENHTSKLTRSSETRSRNGGQACTVVFVNQLSEAVELFWRNDTGDRIRYATIAPGKEYRQPTFAGHLWEMLDPKGGTLSLLPADPLQPRILIDGKSSEPKSEPSKEGRKRRENGLSPDGRWRAHIQGRQIVLRDTREKESVTLSAEIPEAARCFGDIVWSPRSDAFVVSATAPVTTRQVTIVQTSPPADHHPRLITFDYAKPGDALPQPAPVLLRLKDGAFQPVVVDTATFPNQFITSNAHQYTWSDDGGEFYFDVNDRGHQRYRILAVDADTAAVRAVVDETSATFIDYTRKTWRHWLPESRELFWLSERNGWCHLWKIDATGERPPKQITTGNWVVREVLHVDPAAETIWFTASGLREGEDPYHVHCCRVKFDGSEFRQLTEGDGTHEVEFSPDRQLLIDTWSRVDQPPVVELRRGTDGTLVARLEGDSIETFQPSGFVEPERFTAKGRDGKTDIYGIVVKPSHFDPTRRYPVLEDVYAGPHAAFTPKKFGSHGRLQALADLGFVVVQADGMGTNFRGKAFHDVCWKNLKDAGFPDRIAWIKAAAAARPWMDLSRVGIMGGSAGGQTAMRALLDHADFYHVAVADCGCHDNRVDKIWWNEQWMGWPIDESYARSSNVDDAAKLRGELLLIVGELDHNVDPASTYQVAGALQRAGKSFELMPVINTGHGAAETRVGSQAREQFLKRHLKP